MKLPDFGALDFDAAAAPPSPAAPARSSETPEGIPLRGAYGPDELEGVAHLGSMPGLPPFVRGGGDNGAFFHSRHLWVQNEHTSHLKDLVDRRSFAALLADVEPTAKSPEASLRCLRPRPGFVAELVACEPLVQDPVALEWGPDGKLWVVEMGIPIFAAKNTVNAAPRITAAIKACDCVSNAGRKSFPWKIEISLVGRKSAVTEPTSVVMVAHQRALR